MEKMLNNLKQQNVLVYFSDHKTDSANADLFKIWGRKYKLPVIYGYDVLDGVSVAKEKVKESNKVLLFVTDLGNTKDFLKKIIECKVDNNIVLFTTHHLNSEICIYAKKKGIQVILLPLTCGYKLNHFL